MSWEIANRNLIAKAISELYFEEIISQEVREIKKGLYALKIEENLTYIFEAYKSVWCHLVIDERSLKRSDGLELDAANFFKETQHLTKMNDITLANFMEEMLHTLYSDQTILKKKISSQEMSQLGFLEVESYLDGHPKIILNKGRIGWSPDDLSMFSPEHAKEIQFYRVAIKKNLVTVNHQKEKFFSEIIYADLEKREINLLKEKLANKKYNAESYYIIPIHPWQWENRIKIFFQKDISKNNIIFLSSAGDSYKPYISLRTFSNCSNPYLCDVKLPISILNTSCIRGIPARYISIASEISEGVEAIIKQDDCLFNANVDCLKDIAAFSYVEPSYKNIPGAPYQYKEFLGAVWRESSVTKLKSNEKCLMTGALSYLDGNKKSLIGCLIENSSLTIDEWLEEYFKKVVIPLYHLQSHYGIGLVAHGQNTILKLNNNAPSGLIIKDFHGDLRLNKNFPAETRKYFSDKTIEKLDILPSDHIIYDLITGHFISVLRFISQALFLSHGYKEKKFYSVLGTIIHDYEKKYPTRSKTPSLLTPNYHRVLLNKVRFIIGYQDTAQRPKPQLGNPLLNPLIEKDYLYA
ncbi:Siderophore synthetase component, IucA/IucC [Nitrosococcus oceani ATCC 19707]|uniref:Siderophore synthetase component, IucA/IucC n=2 Tax=Nitrosococcus oceani TaxID=1229 RepID=Q3JA64_NITOC|nr:IucA/IucC family protein [Nitrosococcus oceani]ABA58282.1 Siderophore synthetase component, IucA/IucC [Nitrosococcus oceani ATCC 19707]EDZ67438.1 siderophore biosynthesis protein, IucA/IucC family [Nitrosococcus oceani AFC27]KFI19209.1 short-chain oxidoreductase [Nitrosococcus oceani C-27]GEM18663.1 short-chain oxidoreductase [Nitrosococcus oceani]